jgi:WD40 repeat protein
LSYFSLPENQRFAWQPGQLVQVLGDPRGRHWGAVECVAFSPDGRSVASGGEDGVRIWDALTMRERHWLPHNKWVLGLRFLNNTRLWTSDTTEMIQWDLSKGGQPIKASVTPGSASWLSPDGRYVLGDFGRVTLREADTGQVLQTYSEHIHSPRVGVAFSPDKQLAARAFDATGAIVVWNLETRKEINRFGKDTGAGWVRSLVFSPDGKTLASVCYNDGTARLWEISTGKCLREWKKFPFFRCVTFAPDGQRVALGNEAFPVRLWEIERDKEPQEFNRAELHGNVDCLAFSPDGTQLVAGTSLGQVVVWDVLSGAERVPLIGPAAGVRSLSVSNDGSRVFAVGEGDTVRSWNVLEGNMTRQYSGSFHKGSRVAFSPIDNRALVSDRRGVIIWDTTTHQKVREFKDFPSSANGVAWFPDGKRIAVCGDDWTVRVWEADTGKGLLVLNGHTTKVRVVAISPGGDRVLSGSYRPDESLRLWNAETGQRIPGFVDLRYSVSSVAFSPDGRWILSGTDEGSVHLWDANNPNTPLTEIKGLGPVHAVAFVPGKSATTRLAVAHQNGAISFYDDKGRDAGEWKLPGAVYSLAFSSDGLHVFTGNSNGTVYVLRMPPPQKP